MPPDLNDPAERAAYRRELRAVARPVRYMGIALVLLAVLLGALRSAYPALPRAIPIFLLVVGALHMFGAILVRARHHQTRMRG